MIVSQLALTYEPLLPVVVIAAAALLAAGLSVWAALGQRHGLILAGLRLIAIGGIAWALLNPIRQMPTPSYGIERPTLTLLVDTSLSMAQPDAGPAEDTPRLTYARQTWLSEQMQSRLRKVAEVEIRNFDQGLSGSDDSAMPDGRATQLFEAVSRTDTDLTVVVSDGHDTTGRGVPDTSQRPGTLFAVPVGAARSAPDLAVQAWAQSDRLFDKQATRINAQLYQRGLSSSSVAVTLLKDGQAIDKKNLTLDQTLAEVSFEIRPSLPANQASVVHHYRVTAELLDSKDQEATVENNAEDVFVQVSRDKVRVLVIEGMPHWETRGLSRVLAQSPRFDVEGWYAFGDQRLLDIQSEDRLTGDSAAKTNRFAGFDVVVLGRRIERLISAEDANDLTRFVQDSGGAVVFARGRPTTSGASGQTILQALSPIAPVEFGQERSAIVTLAESAGTGGEGTGALSRLGEQVQWTELPNMLAVTDVQGRRAASVVLLSARENGAGTVSGSAAAVVTLRAGAGATLAVLTDGLWRWELAGGGAGESAYAAFWTRAVQWLAAGGAFLPGQDVSLDLSSLTTKPGQPIVATVSTRFVDPAKAQPDLVLIDSEGDRQPLEPTRGTDASTTKFEIASDQQGVYRLELSMPGHPDLIDPAQPITARFAVVDRSVEYRDTSARPDVLRMLVEPTGGICLETDEIDPVLAAAEAITLARGSDARKEPAFNTPLLLSLVGGSLGLHWLIRRREGEL